MSALAAVAERLRADGGLLSDVVDERPPLDDALGRLAAQGPRARGREETVGFVVEAVREGELVHHGVARVVRTESDPDLGILAGDRLYAHGLAALAQEGDLDAIAELADVIALCAQAHAAGDQELAAAVWHAGAVAVGWGPSEAHREAKAAAAQGLPSAASTLRQSAHNMARRSTDHHDQTSTL